MHNSNQRTIFNDVNLFFGTLASNSLKDLKQQLRWILRALNQVILSSATPNTRRAHVKLETDEGEDEGKDEGESSRRLLGSEVRRPAPRLGTTGQLDVPLEEPVDRPAKKLKHVSKEGKVVSIVTGPSSCVVFPG